MRTRNALTIILTIGMLIATSAHAEIKKADNTDALNLPGSWLLGAVPTAADIAEWDSTVLGANTTVLGGDLNWQGVKISDPGGNVLINAGNTLTLGASGIDMSAATRDLDIRADLALGAAQTWNVNAGRRFTFNGGTIDNGGNTLTIDTEGTIVIEASAGHRIIDAGALIKTGAGTLRIGGEGGSGGGITHDFTGQLWVKEGALQSGKTNLSIGPVAEPILLGDVGTTGIIDAIRYYTGFTFGKDFTLVAGGAGELRTADRLNLTFTGVIDGAGDLIKSSGGGDGGYLIMTAAHTYIGTTTLTGGKLTLTGSLANSNITVQDGTFMGDGTITYNLGSAPDLITLTSGALDISALTVDFAGSADLNKYVVADYSAGGILTTEPNLDTDNTFFNATNVPTGYFFSNDTVNMQIVLIPELLSVMTGNWNNISTWDGGTTPSATTGARVRNSHIVTVAAAGAAPRLTIDDGGEMRVSNVLGSGVPVTKIDVTADGGSGGGALSVQSGGALNAATLNTAGATGFQAGSTAAITTLNTGGTTNLSGPAVVIDTMNVTGGVTSIDSPTITQVNATGGILNAAGSGTTNLNVDGAEVNTSAAAGAVDLQMSSGQLNLTGGDLSVVTASVTGGVMDASANALVVSDQAEIGSTTASISGPAFDVSGSDVLAAHTLTINGGTLTLTTRNLPAAFTAYNDSVTPFAGGNTTQIGRFTGTVASGLLKDYATGVDTGVTATHVDGGSNGPGGGGPMPNVGTEANTIFDGKVNFGLVTGSGTEMSNLIYYGGANWYQEVVFTGLDSSLEYTFASLHNRGKYTDRWTVVSIQDAESSTYACSDGAFKVSDNAVSLLSDQASTGYVAKWTNIKPGIDGSFTIHYTYSRTEGVDRPAGTGQDGVKAYPLAGFMLQEISDKPETIDLSTTTLRAMDDAMVVIDTPGIVTLGGIEVADDKVLTVNSDSTDIQLTKLTLGGGSMVKSTAATAADVTITVGGRLSGGDGVSSLGDSAGGELNTNLTLSAGASFDWTFTKDDAATDEWLGDLVFVNGELEMADGLDIHLVDGGGSSGVASVDVVLFQLQAGGAPFNAGQINIDAPSLSWTWGELEYVNDEFVVLRGLVTGAVVAPHAGDANNDGKVDHLDLGLFDQQFGLKGSHLSCDFNNDDVVGIDDLAILRANFGWVLPTAPGDASSPTGTPEPATMSLLALGLPLLLKRKRLRLSASSSQERKFR